MSEQKSTPAEAQIDRIAAAIAAADNADYWVEEIADWEHFEEWKREAYPYEYPSSAYEDRERYRKQARAAVVALEPEAREEPTKQLASYVHDIKLARHIVIDDNVTIDGFVLPWWVTQDMAIADLTGEPEGSALGLQTVTLSFFADRVTVDEEKVAELGTTITRISFDREPREESEDDEPAPSLADCPACDTTLGDCSPDAACCEDCSHTANWPAPAHPEREREKARAWDVLAQHPIFAGSEGLARIQALAMWRKLDSLVDVPAPETREVTDAEVEAALVGYGYLPRDLNFDPGARMRAALEAAREVQS